MKPIRSTLKFLFLPYVRLYGDGKQSIIRLCSLRSAAKRKAEENAAGPGAAEVLAQANGPADAFCRLYEHNRWTPDRLAAQRREVRRAKWISLALFWMGVCAMVGAAMFLHSRYALLLGIGFPGLFAFFMCVQTLRYALFQAQIDTKSLISFKQFFSRADFFLRVFS